MAIAVTVMEAEFVFIYIIVVFGMLPPTNFNLFFISTFIR